MSAGEDLFLVEGDDVKELSFVVEDGVRLSEREDKFRVVPEVEVIAFGYLKAIIVSGRVFIVANEEVADEIRQECFFVLVYDAHHFGGDAFFQQCVEDCSCFHFVIVS